jgi:hypothetical protein
MPRSSGSASREVIPKILYPFPDYTMVKKEKRRSHTDHKKPDNDVDLFHLSSLTVSALFDDCSLLPPRRRLPYSARYFRNNS